MKSLCMQVYQTFLLRLRGSGSETNHIIYEKDREREMSPEMCKESGEAYLQWDL